MSIQHDLLDDIVMDSMSNDFDKLPINFDKLLVKIIIYLTKVV